MQKRTLSQMYGNKIASGGNVKKRTLSEMYGSKTGGLNVSAKPVGTQTVKKEEPKDNGGPLGGALFVGEKLLTGLVSSVEGAFDTLGVSLAKFFGDDAWAEDIIKSDWFGDWYSHPEQWFNPSEGWKAAGDIAGGIGTSGPALAATIGLSIATGGAAAPVAIGGFLSAALPAAGRGMKEAYDQTGTLGDKELIYGALSGGLEGGLESVTDLIGWGTGTLIKSFTKSFAKEATEAAVKDGLIKTIGKSFIGEAFEEGASEFLDPYIKRATYDAGAKDASPDEIIYAGLIGGLPGAVMGGGGYGINTANSFIKGHKLTTKGGESEVLQTSDYILGKAQKDALDADIFKEIAETREKLTLSLESTGGKVETLAQKKMLGDLSRANVVGAINMGVARRALNIVNNAPDIAKRLSAFGYKDTNGRAMTFTAEELTAGYDPKKPSSIYKALKENAQLRSLAVADAAGALMIDTRKFTEATLTGKKLASQVDINRFVKSATAEEIKAVSDALKIDDWRTLTRDTLAEKITEYLNEGGLQRNLQEKELRAEFEAATPLEGYTIPKTFLFKKDGVRRFSDGSGDIGISKSGDAYRIFDYDTRAMTKEMTRAEVNTVLRDYDGKRFAAFESERRRLAEIEAMQKENAEIEELVRTNVKDYAKLSAPAQSQIERIVREGRAKGVSDSDVLMYAKVAAHSGLDIVFDKEATRSRKSAESRVQNAELAPHTSAEYADGYYDASRNLVVINPEATRTAERLLIHELDHAIRKSLGKNGATRIYFEAIKNVDQATRDKITKTYKKTAKPGEAAATIMDETNAYYAEQVLGNKYTLEKLVEAEPSLKEKILSFFKGASEDYADVPKLSGAAKKYYRTYKKLFDEFSARNAENNAIEPFTNKNGSNVNENGVSDNVRTINGNNMSVSDRQYALTDALNLLGEYDATRKRHIESSGKDRVVRNYSDIMDFIRKSRDNIPFERIHIGIVNDNTAQLVKTKTGVDIKGYDFVIPSNSVYHVYGDHGNPATEALRGHIAVDDKNIENIIETIISPDDVVLVSDSTNTALRFEKMLDGQNVAITIVSTKKSTLSLKSAWIINKNSGGRTPSANANALAGTPEANSRSSTTVIIPENQKNVKDFDKKSLENSSDRQNALPLDVEHNEALDSPWVGRAEREAVSDVLSKEVKTAEERDTLNAYISELDVLEEKLIERSKELKRLSEVKKQKNEMYKTAKTPEDRKAVSSSKEMKELRKRQIDIEEKINLVEDEISRRDSELLRLSSARPLYELVTRAYKIGKEDGATAKISQGLINKRIAAVLHSKFFTLKEAISIVDKINEKYPIGDFNVKSEMARRLWTQLNATEDTKEQKAALKKVADDINKASYVEKTTPLKNEIAFVKRAKKYQKRIAFTEYERKNLTKYYGDTAKNILSIWEYDGNKSVAPQKLSDVLWDVGQVSKYKYYETMENSAPSFRADAFYDMVSEFENTEKELEPLRNESKSRREDILDMLIRGFMDGGKETYRQKYEDLSRSTKIRDRIEVRAESFTKLIRGVFTNSTTYKGDLFVNTLDQIPKIMYRGTLYDGRVRKVAKGLNEWYNTKNPMLCYDESDPNSNGIYRPEIKDMLETLAMGEEMRRLSDRELEMLEELLKYFHNFVEMYNKVYRNGKWEDALVVAEGYMKKAKMLEQSEASALESLFRNKYVDNFGDPETVMRIADGYTDGIFTETYNEIREGFIAAKVLEMHTLEEYERFMKKNSKDIQKLGEKTENVRGVNVPHSRLWGYYLSLGRKHLWAGAAFSGYVYPKADGNGNQRVPAFMQGYDSKSVNAEELKSAAEAERNRIKALFSQEEIEYLNIVRRLFDTAGDIKQEADMNMYGYSNVCEGEYYPGRRYEAGQNAGLDMYSEMQTVDRFTHASFNQNTVKGAAQALFIEDVDVVVRRHIKNLSLYAKLSPAVDNFNRIWRLNVAESSNLPTSLSTMMKENERAWRIDGKIVGYEYLKDMIADIMGRDTKGSKIMSMLRRNYATFALGGVIGANPKVAVTQLSSLIASSSILSYSSLVKGVGISGAEVDKYCYLAELRNMDDSAVKAQGVTEKISKVGEKATSLINKMDRVVVTRLFAACQAEVAKNGRLPIGTERNKVAAGKLLHKVILETQQNALTTERTKSMRSDSEFMKMWSMFRSDSIKNTGRVIDALGELLFVRKQIIATKSSGASTLHLERQYKKAGKKLAKSLSALLINSAAMVGIAKLFEWLYAKEDDEDEPLMLECLVDFGGNLVGGLPVISQLYSRFIEGYDFEGFEYSMINDFLDTVEQFGKTVYKGIEGKATSDDIMSCLERMADATGQMTGIPTRNVRNTLYGLTKRVAPSFAYRVDDLFGSKNYAKDLNRALEAGDETLALTVLELALGEKLGSGFSDKSIKALAGLVGKGESVMPSAISDTLTINGEEITLSGAQISAVHNRYTEAIDAVNSLVGTVYYNGLSSEQQAKAIRKIYSEYKNLAYDEVLGTDKSGKAGLIRKAVFAGVFNAYLTLGVQESDKDREGKTIAGSKRAKVVKAIGELGVSPEERLLLICASGYSLKDGDIRGVSAERAKTRLLKYILNLKGVSAAEKAEIAEMCGFEVKNGRIVRNSAGALPKMKV